MGFFYRRRKGPLTFSGSRRGLGVSFRLGSGRGGGCLLPAALMLALAGSGLAAILR